MPPPSEINPASKTDSSSGTDLPLVVGQSYRTARIVHTADVARYCEAVERRTVGAAPGGDLHVPGPLLIGQVSQVLGSAFPGPGTVVVSLKAQFERCIRAGRAFQIEVRVAGERAGHDRLRVEVTVRGEDGLAMSGAAVLVPPAGDEAANA